MYTIDMLCKNPYIRLLTLSEACQWIDVQRGLLDMFDVADGVRTYHIIDMSAITTDLEQIVIDTVRARQKASANGVVIFVTRLKDYPRHIFGWWRQRVMPTLPDALAWIYSSIAQDTYIAQ